MSIFYFDQVVMFLVIVSTAHFLLNIYWILDLCLHLFSENVTGVIWLERNIVKLLYLKKNVPNERLQSVTTVFIRGIFHSRINTLRASFQRQQTRTKRISFLRKLLQDGGVRLFQFKFY